jgi:hypothetical protein
MKIGISTFFYDKKVGFFLKLGPRAARCCPRAGPGSPTFEFVGTGGHGPRFFKITGGHGQWAAKCHGLLTSNLASYTLHIFHFHKS